MAGPYDAQWQKARLRFLGNHPLCVICLKRGRVSPATVVDHIKPHKGDMELFWDSDNWQSLCKQCHDGHKQSIEKGGIGRMGAALDGVPVDPAHHWNEKK